MVIFVIVMPNVSFLCLAFRATRLAGGRGDARFLRTHQGLLDDGDRQTDGRVGQAVGTHVGESEFMRETRKCPALMLKNIFCTRMYSTHVVFLFCFLGGEGGFVFINGPEAAFCLFVF